MPTTIPLRNIPIWPVIVLAVSLFGIGASEPRPLQVADPGVRDDTPGAGGPITELNDDEKAFFEAGKAEFEEGDDVENGIGPRMNLDSCAGCHSYPATGGSSPEVNPQVMFASKDGGKDSVPFFISEDGPIREARFKFNRDGTRDGGVHNTFTVTGRTEDTNCNLEQPDFETEFAKDNLIFRIPTPLFGAGLIEQVPDSAILANQAVNADKKKQLGIDGRPNQVKPGHVTGLTNNNGNDGRIARFGWKAQNQSLLLFSGEAYNVEMGITNELFQSEREKDCQYATVPNNVTDTDPLTPLVEGLSAIELFAFFQRFLAPPEREAPEGVLQESIDNGEEIFTRIGCALCHTPTLKTGDSTVTALSYKDVNLYSDLLLHNMGPGLADDILQGQALGDEFRTAPLWGLGQRIFFLHDGRTTDLVEAIQEHRSRGNEHKDNGKNNKFKKSEAYAVIDNFDRLEPAEQQDLLNFLRSL